MLTNEGGRAQFLVRIIFGFLNLATLLIFMVLIVRSDQKRGQQYAGAEVVSSSELEGVELADQRAGPEHCHRGPVDQLLRQSGHVLGGPGEYNSPLSVSLFFSNSLCIFLFHSPFLSLVLLIPYPYPFSLSSLYRNLAFSLTFFCTFAVSKSAFISARISLSNSFFFSDLFSLIP